MNKHPYLRAYLAGIAVPTVFLLVIMTSYTVIRYVWDVPIAIERVIVFPMAAVPMPGGCERAVPCVLCRPARFSGCVRRALPLLLGPGGYVVARLLDFTIPHEVFVLAPFGLPVALIIYYLAWKYFVGFLNAELGIA